MDIVDSVDKENRFPMTEPYQEDFRWLTKKQGVMKNAFVQQYIVIGVAGVSRKIV